MKTRKGKYFTPNYIVIDLIDKKGYIMTDRSAVMEKTKISRYLLEERLKSGFFWEGRYVICVKPAIIQSKRKNASKMRQIALT